MKLGRFLHEGNAISGIITRDEIKVIKSFEDPEPTGEAVKFKELRFLPPTEPSKIVCIGLNYIDHAKELKMQIPREPVIFIKPPTAAIAHEENIVYPKASNQVDYEAELAVVIGDKCRNILREDAYRVIAGYTIFNDVTARDLQRRDIQWTRAKSFDTFAPFGPYLVTKDEIKNPHNLDIRLRLNGELRQNSNTRNLIFDIPYLIEFISEIMTLNKGDIIATGTPPGVGELKKGDRVEIEIQDIGILRNSVV